VHVPDKAADSTYEESLPLKIDEELEDSRSAKTKQTLSTLSSSVQTIDASSNASINIII